MWQRIQTLYLAIATGLIVSMFFTLKAVIPAADGGIAESYRFVSYWPYLILLVVITVLDILALTGWKFRVFQMRTAILAALVTLALQAWLAVDYFTAAEGLVFRATAIFPIVAVILDLLAARKIYADQLLVESMSRLRSPRRK
jgi:hypothetical protein